jgi:flagellar P-ring protein precursor FlgI
MKNKKLILILILCLVTLAAGLVQADEQPKVRIKDIARFEGVRDNQLLGLGLVIGLNGTGDSTKSQASIQMVANMLSAFDLTVSENDIRMKNVAAVIVTAELPAFVREGDRIDITVSSFGDAKSLQGGFLLMTPLQAANGEVYAVAQGPVSIGGFNVRSNSGQVQSNHTQIGRVANGAIVEKDAPGYYAIGDKITLLLNQPDFTTASRIAAAINEYFTPDTAYALDRSAVVLKIPALFKDYPVEFISLVEELEVIPDTIARIIINERTGTVVVGHNVRIGTVAVAHGGLSVKIGSTPKVTQPNPFSEGQTAIITEDWISVSEESGNFVTLPKTANVNELVKALNAVGATPRDIINILQAIKEAGALYGVLEVM